MERTQPPARRGYWTGLVLLTAVIAVYFWPVWIGGEVYYQQDNSVLLGVRDAEPGETVIKNDQVIQYVPAMQRHLSGNHAAWLATWDPTTQLGRPLMQLSAVGKAFLPTHILSFFISDPYVLYTALMTLIVLLTAGFLFLFLRGEGCDVWIGWTTAFALPLGLWMAPHLRNLPMTFNVCWTTGLLAAAAAFLRKPSFPSGLAVSFTVYGLLMTSYPQLTVLTAYFCAGYAFILLKKCPTGTRMKRALTLIFCVLAGVASVLPYYADLYVRAARSIRLDMAESYFFHGVGDPDALKRFVKVFTDFTPLYMALYALSFTKGYGRRFWLWKGMVVACLALALVPPARFVAVRFLGFGLSAGFHFLLYGLLIPVFVTGAFMLRELFAGKVSRSRIHGVMLACVLPVLALKWVLLPALAGKSPNFLADTEAVWMLALFAASYVFFLKPGRILLVCIVLAGVFGFREHKTMNPGDILRSSELTEAVRRHTEDGSRYGFFGEEGRHVLPPNMESLAGLRSIHSYDSLSSADYQRLAGRLSETGATADGRLFDRILPESRVDSEPYTYTGMTLVLSNADLSDFALRRIGQIGSTRLYRTPFPAILEAQTARFRPTANGEVYLEGPLNEHRDRKVRRVEDFEDRLAYEVEDVPGTTLLFISQQYHPHWRARSGQKRLITVVINDFYQGVLVPPGTRRVLLEFKPYVLWMWVPQLLFAVGGVLCLVLMVKRPQPVIK